MAKDFMTRLAYLHPVNPQPVKKRKDWTHVLASDGSPHFTPALARYYMSQHGLRGKLKFIRPN